MTGKTEPVGQETGKHRDKLTVTLENTNRAMKIMLRQVKGLEKARKGFIQLGDMENASRFNFAVNQAVDQLNALVIVPTDLETAEAKKEKADFDLMSIVVPDAEPETAEEIAEEIVEETVEETPTPKKESKPKQKK